MKAQIFVAEDDNYLRDLYVQLLQKEGYGVEFAADGEDALAKLRTKPCRQEISPDFVDIDVLAMHEAAMCEESARAAVHAVHRKQFQRHE